MNNPDTFRILLVHPPVAAPTAPPWALAHTAGQLSGPGQCLEKYDANLDFFINHFLTSKNLTELVGVIEKKIEQGAFKKADDDIASLLVDLAKNREHWMHKIAKASDCFEALRSEDFYLPDTCMTILKDIRDLLALGSLAFYPSCIRFDSFSSPEVKDWTHVKGFIGDKEKNPFLFLCERGLAQRFASLRPSLLILFASSPDQLLAALTMAYFSKKQRPDLHTALVGHDMLLEGATDYFDSLLPETDQEPLLELVVRLGGKTAPGEAVVPDFSGLPIKDYLTPAVVLPFGALSGPGTDLMAPPIYLTVLKEQVQRFRAEGFFIKDDRLTPAYMTELAGEMTGEKPPFFTGLTCTLDESTTAAIRTTMNAASHAGVRIIQWQDPTGQSEPLTMALWDVCRNGVWNHVVIPTEMERRLEQGLVSFMDANPNIVHSWVRSKPPGLSFESSVNKVEQEKRGYTQVAKLPGHPLWRGLNDLVYILLYVNRFGIKKVMRWRVRDDGSSVYALGQEISYHFVKPQELPLGYLDEICRMVEAGGSVGTRWVRYNLERAFLIGYAIEEGLIVGNSSLKRPRPEYVEAVSRQSDLNLSHYLERGYTSVRPEYRGMGIGAKLLEGLTVRVGKRKLFSIIGEDNVATQKIALRNKTRRVATFYSERLGKNVGVWIPERMLEN
jgi:GNAT superfamily N-acetyltransferase